MVVDKSVKDYKANSLAYLFCGHNFSGAYYYLKNAKKFIGLENLNTDNVLTMSSMFWGCKSIDTLDVSGFNTENVTSIGSMFRDCESLKVLNISSFALPKVTDIRMAFYDCKALKTIYCNYDWNSLTTLTQSANTFSNCNALEGAHGTAYSSEHKDKEYARPDKSGTPGYFTSVIEMIDSEKAVIDIYKGYIATIKNYIGMFTFEGVTKFVKDLGDRISTLEDILSITGSDMSTYKTMKNGRNLAETYYNTSREDYINLVIEATKRDINNLGETDDSEASQKILTDAQTACDTIGKVWVGYQTVIDNVKDVWDLSEFIYEEAKEDVITQRLNEAKAVLNDTITEMQALYAFANSFLEDKSMLAPLQTAIETAQAVYNTAGVQRPEIQEATKKAHEAFVTAVEALMDKAKKEMKAELDQMDVKDCDKCHNIIADAKDEVDALTWDYSKNVKVNTDALYGDGQSIYSKAQQQISLATGIGSVQNSEVRIQKVVRDGQLLIIRDGKMYNAQGAEVR